MNRRTFLKMTSAAAGAALSDGIIPNPPHAEITDPALAEEAFGTDLFRDDFSRLPPGWLSRPVGQLYGAIQQHHYLATCGVSHGPWANAICHLDAWIVGDEDGNPYLEQHLANEQSGQMNPILLTGDPEWHDCSVEVKVKPLSTTDMAGVVFRYHTNLHYYLFALTGGTQGRLAVRLPLEKLLRVAEWRELGRKDFTYDGKKYYVLRVEAVGHNIKAYVDNRLLFQVTDEELPRGKAGITANIPARFQDFRVSTTPTAKARITEGIRGRDAELQRLRSDNPEPAPWKRFFPPGFGAGRSARFGHLDG
ncbi:MAG: hypothetical protein DMG70_17890 [Acidobacteria bacterium]|nr:MAG: hypothetical protein DMG70_17890 [Acidobacteriota bacterium]